MTHGVGFDRSYWDLPYPHDSHSYVARAVDQHGYSTLTWDRLGVGMSSHIDDTVNGLQIFLEIAALRRLTELARAGKLDELVGRHQYHSIVHIGHSFGSAMTYNLVNMYPNISQGIILQGFTQVPNYMGLFALGGNFVPAKEVSVNSLCYPEGYVASGSRAAIQTNFFGPDDVDKELLDLAFNRGQPHTVGELLTVGAGAGIPNVFRGPVMVLTGRRCTPIDMRLCVV